MFMNRTSGCNISLTEEVWVFQKVAYIPIFGAGLILNSAALIVFFLKRASWTETHVYMMNLAVADLALIVFLPVKIYSAFDHSAVWDICPLLFSVYYLNMYASMFLQTAISVHRFIVVKFPFGARADGLRKRTAAVLCLLIWATVALMCIFFEKLNRKDQLKSCFVRQPEPAPLPYLLGALIPGFFIPFCTTLFCSSQAIFSLLRDKNAVTREERRKFVAVVTANLIVFIVCYTPRHIALLVKYNVGTQSQYNFNCAAYNLAYNILCISDWIATTNCCLDSIAYYFLFKNMWST
ncbi:hypothetical protein GJAV_G00122860 [Gymnothorax javanicus]|nr:hypothetical protein GJAV_G00122860 [Gymnothorax javanicus]